MDSTTLLSFLALDLLLVCVPGADWAYTIAAGVRGRSVPAAVGGLVCGYAVHTALAVAGLAVLFPPLAVLILAALVFLLAGGRRREGEKYAGLRILR